MYKKGKKFHWYVQLFQEAYSKPSQQLKKPLIQLTKKFTKFEWNKECQDAFHFLKERLTTVQVLVYPDIIKPYILYMDASDDCTWACLCQEQDTQGEMRSNKPNKNLIDYLTHKLTASLTNWPTIEK